MAANPNYSVPSFTSVAAKLHYPTYNEWNLQIQRQLSHSQSIQVGYVGDRGYHEPVESVGVNAVGGFGLPNPRRLLPALVRSPRSIAPLCHITTASSPATCSRGTA